MVLNPRMKYTIIKFESNYGGQFYQVRIHCGWFFSWLKGASGEVLTFESKEAVHEHMSRLPGCAPRRRAVAISE
jgi:hypothetical protein